MGLRTPEQFRNSLRDGRVVYYKGKRVEDVAAHPVLKIGVDSSAVDYELAEDPQWRELAVVESADAAPFSRFFLAPRSSEDLLRRRKLVETGSRICFGFPPFAKEGGSDAVNALAIVTSRCDAANGTNYARRLETFRSFLQREDLSISITMTDAKGDRSLRPSEQADPDLYLRKVRDVPGGIIVRGAKAHITTAPYTNEFCVLPTRALSAAERAYAVAFAIPANTSGIRIIARSGPWEEGFIDYPVANRASMVEGLVIFDDVFVPDERIFLNGEWQFAGPLAQMFANYHRVTAAAYKYPFAELLAGSAQLVAECNGVDRVAHVRDKIAWLVMYAESILALSEAACHKAVQDPGTGLYYPDPVIGNAGKFFFADNYHAAVKAVQDIAGGIIATIPSEHDWNNPETQPYLAKYLAGSQKATVEERFRVIHLIKDLVASELGGFWEVTSLHAEGSLAAERLATYAHADMKRYRDAARRAAQLGPRLEQPLPRTDSERHGALKS
ncbi:MAG: 4-hydroxybutyryl-CoA dehydratase [Acidobacteria bacterium]|nr:4-hydroxybutyryl-CoA dehydratase [Acidobacteriota bacterium]